MLQELRLVKHLHCAPGLYDEPLTAVQIFRMATENGARSIGFGDEIGSIEPGKRADLVLLDYDRIAAAYLDPAISPIDAIIYRARNTDVDTVMIDGKIVFQDGRTTRIDRSETLERIARSLDRRWSLRSSRDGASFRRSFRIFVISTSIGRSRSPNRSMRCMERDRALRGSHATRNRLRADPGSRSEVGRACVLDLG